MAAVDLANAGNCSTLVLFQSLGNAGKSWNSIQKRK